MAGYCRSDTHCVIRYSKGQKDKGTECSTRRIFIPEYPVAVNSYGRQFETKRSYFTWLVSPVYTEFSNVNKNFHRPMNGRSASLPVELAENWKVQFEVFLGWWNPHLLYNSLLYKSWIVWGQVQIQPDRLRIYKSTTSVVIWVWFDLGRMKKSALFLLLYHPFKIIQIQDYYSQAYMRYNYDAC